MVLRTLVWLIASAVLFASSGTEAQQTINFVRIGYLSATNVARDSSRVEAIRSALREFGYIEGQNIAFEYRYAEGKIARYRELAAELVQSKVQIILVAGGTVLIQAAQTATRTIPIVMAGTPGDPVEAGLVQSLARPGGNVTGVTILSRELSGKRLELLKDALPRMARVAVLYAPATAGAAREVKEVLPAVAPALGMSVRSWEVRGADDFAKVFNAINKQRFDGLFVSPDALLGANQKRIIGFALESRLPSMFSSREAVDAGGLLYYGADAGDSYRRVAHHVDRILKGTKPADLPVEQPMKFEFIALVSGR